MRLAACPVTWRSRFWRPLVGVALRGCWALVVCPPTLPHTAPGGPAKAQKSPTPRGSCRDGVGQSSSIWVTRGSCRAVQAWLGFTAHSYTLVQASAGLITCARLPVCPYLPVFGSMPVRGCVFPPVPIPTHTHLSVASYGCPPMCRCVAQVCVSVCMHAPTHVHSYAEDRVCVLPLS